MHESEAGQSGVCSDCGAEVARADRMYVFGAEEVLCFECSLKRHGTYDELQDRWTVAPDVDDLLARSALDL